MIRRSPISRFPKKKPQVRVGKLGIIRLSGAAMEQLRLDCWNRDEGACQECGKRLRYETSWEGADDRYHMAHIKAKRNNGDTLENVRALCGDCHRAEHGNKLPKDLRD